MATTGIDGQGNVRHSKPGTKSSVLEFAGTVTTTEKSDGEASVADGATFTIPFGGVSAAKVFALLSDGLLTVKLNGESTGHVFNPRFYIEDSAGGVTSATVTNSSGAARIVEYMVAG